MMTAKSSNDLIFSLCCRLVPLVIFGGLSLSDSSDNQPRLPRSLLRKDNYSKGSHKFPLLNFSLFGENFMQGITVNPLEPLNRDETEQTYQSPSRDPVTLAGRIFLGKGAEYQTVTQVTDFTVTLLSKNDVFPYACFCYDFVIEAVFMGVLCLLGLLGNAASVVCLSHDKTRNATPFLLISLAMADTMFLITVFFLRVLSSVHTFGWSLLFVVKTAPYMAKYVYPAALLSQTAAIYLTVLVTLNRFMAVCYPYIASDVCSLRNAKFHVTAVVVFSIIFNIPRFFQIEIVCSDDQLAAFQTSNVSLASELNLNLSVNLHDYSTSSPLLHGASARSIQLLILEEPRNSTDARINSTYYPPIADVTCQIKDAPFAVHPFYSIVYASIAYCVVMFLIPLVSLSFFNVRLIGALRVAKARREKLLLKRKRVESARNKAAATIQERKHSSCLSAKSQETNLLGKDQSAVASPSTVNTGVVSRSDDDITFMLVVVVMVFVVTQSPALLTQLLYCILSENERNCPHAFFFYERLSDLLVVANSSLNFVIYCFCSARFRQNLIELIFGKSKQQLQQLQQQQQRGATQGPRSRMEMSQCNPSCQGEPEQQQQQQQQQVLKANNLTVPSAIER